MVDQRSAMLGYQVSPYLSECDFHKSTHVSHSTVYLCMTGHINCKSCLSVTFGIALHSQLNGVKQHD